MSDKQRLPELLREWASDSMKGTPMVPIHKNTLVEIADEIERLRAELLRVTELETAIEVRDEDCERLRAENTALTLLRADFAHRNAELWERAEKDRADAQRYRYLRSAERRNALSLDGPEAGVWCDCEDKDGTLVLLTEDDLDAAIDAAMKAGK